MKYVKVSFVLFAFAVNFLFQQSAEAQIKLSNSVFGNGAAVLTGSSNRIIGTVGQTVIGVATNSSNISKVGFWYQSGDLITSVEQISNNLPKEFQLEQNYPNPFNPSTSIQFALPKRLFVTLKLFDILGREVATLVDENLQPGEYKVVLDAKDLASGVYFYRIQAEEFVLVKKLMLLK